MMGRGDQRAYFGNLVPTTERRRITTRQDFSIFRTGLGQKKGANWNSKVALGQKNKASCGDRTVNESRTARRRGGHGGD